LTVGSNGLAQSVLVVGGGMYVAGRGVDGYRGTIGPALLEARRRGVVGRLAVAATRIDTARDAADRLATLGRDMGVDGTIEIFPEDSTDDNPTGTALAAFRPDAAVVAVPDDNHAAVCVPLIHGGVHCLVVKPLAGTVADARTMADAADRTGVVAQVEFHKRLDESNLLLRSAVSEGRLGDPLYAVVEYSQRKTIPRDVFRGWATRTDIFQYLGVHYVDLVHWATGFRPARVTAWGQKVYLAELGIDTWDAMQVVVEWIQPDGRPFVSTHISNWVDPDRTSAMSDQRITIVGTAVAIRPTRSTAACNWSPTTPEHRISTRTSPASGNATTTASPSTAMASGRSADFLTTLSTCGPGASPPPNCKAFAPHSMTG